MQVKLAIAVLAFSSFAVAQHGRPAGAGTGMGSGMSSSAGHSNGMGSEMSGNHGPGGHPNTAAASGKTASDLLTQNTKLSSNLEKLLPGGMSAQQACAGFKNLGQCVAAIHVSHNLDIPFADLKAKMTGSGSESLGKAIGDLKPSANAKAESKKAQQQANQDLSNNS
jgi:hypothetical protein